jgi:3-oxoacyl-[acyl-carrier-protein] synthase II
VTAELANGAGSVAITGIGLLTPLGDALGVVGEALCAGRQAVAAFEPVPGCVAAEMRDFDATRYVNVRGMRLYGRATRLGLAAARLALADAGLEGAPLPPEQLGTVTASTFGHFEALLEYDRSVLTAGVLRGNPALFPLALPSSAGAVIALSFAAKAFSVGLGDGGTSSLDAIGLGARLLAGGRARACLVVGVSSVLPDLVTAASRAGLLAPDVPRPFDRGRRGAVLGDAAAAVVLERPEHARARAAPVHGFVRAQASAQATAQSSVADGLRRACEQAISAAGLSASQIGLLSTGASGLVEADAAEARALVGALGGAAASPPTIAVKGSLGESVDASGLVQTLTAIGAMKSRTVPPIAHLRDPEVTGLRYVTEATPLDARHALVTATSWSGSCSALVVSTDDA